MQIVCLGINHKTAALETREKIAFADKHKKEAYNYLSSSGPLLQVAILSTCNRTEIYALAEEPAGGRKSLLSMLEAVRGVTTAEIENCLYYYSGYDAVVHLFRVAAGLDSMVLGETQVLGQVRAAYDHACLYKAISKELHGLFQQAVRCAKKVQTETKINHNSLSVSYLAVDMIKKELGSFDGLSVLVIGAGKMSRLTLHHLYELGARDIRVTSRTYQRAKDLAHLFNGRTIDFTRKKETLPDIDIIISSTGAPHLLLRKDEVCQVMERREHKPLFMIDIAVPRDIDPAVRELNNVFLYDMDSLQEVVAGNLDERKKDASAASEIVSFEAAEFQRWFKTLTVVPVIKALRKKADQIRGSETEKCLEGKLCSLSEKEKQAVENLTKSIVNAILKDPIIRMKDKAVQNEVARHIDALLHLFDLQREFESTHDEEKCGEAR
jgi:glutamyl-tRNA reductase